MKIKSIHGLQIKWYEQHHTKEIFTNRVTSQYLGRAKAIAQNIRDASAIGRLQLSRCLRRPREINKN